MHRPRQRFLHAWVLGEAGHCLGEHVVGGLALGDRPEQRVQRRPGAERGGQRPSTSASTTSWRSTTVTGFTETFLMATGFLVLCFGAGLLVPKARGVGGPSNPGPEIAAPEGARA